MFKNLTKRQKIETIMATLCAKCFKSFEPNEQRHRDENHRMICSVCKVKPPQIKVGSHA